MIALRAMVFFGSFSLGYTKVPGGYAKKEGGRGAAK